jgi:hypothetical protein
MVDQTVLFTQAMDHPTDHPMYLIMATMVAITVTLVMDNLTDLMVVTLLSLVALAVEALDLEILEDLEALSLVVQAQALDPEMDKDLEALTLALEIIMVVLVMAVLVMAAFPAVSILVSEDLVPVIIIAMETAMETATVISTSILEILEDPVIQDRIVTVMAQNHKKEKHIHSPLPLKLFLMVITNIHLVVMAVSVALTVDTASKSVMEQEEIIDSPFLSILYPHQHLFQSLRLL